MFSNEFIGVVAAIIIMIILGPAIIMLILGLQRLKSKPEQRKKLLLFAMAYLIIGAGLCGSMI